MKKIIKNFFVGAFISLMASPISIFAQKPTAMVSPKAEVLNSFDIYHNDKEVISMDSFFKKKMIVMIFTSSHCSYALHYQSRLNKLYAQYKDKEVIFIAVNSNDSSISIQDSASRMSQFSPFDFPYVKDSDQSIAKKLNASINPEAVVLIPSDKKFKIGYRGQIDDNPLSEKLVKNHSLKSAIESLLLDKKPLQSKTKPNGCEITWIEE